MKPFRLAAALLALLSGCSFAPEYRRPAAPVPAAWPEAAQAPSPPAVEVPEARDLSWREVLPDPRLQRVIEMALENNRDLRLAALNVERTRGIYGIQRGEIYPALGAHAEANRLRRSEDLLQYGQPRTITQYSADLGVTAWEIDLFGRIRSLSEQALEEFLAAAEVRRGVELALVAETAQVFLALVADRERLALAEATLATQQAVYGLVNRRWEVGLSSAIDRKRAELPVETARVEAARLTQLVAQGKNALDLLAGAPVPPEWVPGRLADLAPPREVAPGIPSEVLLRRPDVAAAEHRLKGAYASIGAARAALFPRISLTTLVGTASDELSRLFASGTGTWLFRPQAALPIFDSRLWAALRVSQTEREIVLAQYEKAIQTAFREVADTLAVRRTIFEQLDAQRALLAAAAETYRLARQRYEQGIDSFLGVLDAERTLFAAEQGLVALRQVELASRIRLYAALGGAE
ncbi:MAG: efflux transporter outer membrane subunit [Desulfobacterales bacterium]